MTRQVLIIFAVLLMIATVLGIYAYHLHSRVALEEQRLAQQPQLIASPAGGPATNISLIAASDADGTLKRIQQNLPLPEERSDRLKTVLRALFALYMQPSSPHPLGSGSDIRDVFLLGTDTAIVDTSAGFADSHPAGIMAEELTIASIVATLNVNDPQIRRVKILVDGKERDTLAGHADLRRFYSVGEMEFAAKDNQ
jgi:hypothetical protein